MEMSTAWTAELNYLNLNMLFKPRRLKYTKTRNVAYEKKFLVLQAFQLQWYVNYFAVLFFLFVFSLNSPLVVQQENWMYTVFSKGILKYCVLRYQKKVIWL